MAAKRHWWASTLSLMLTLALVAVPLPDSVAPLRPDWVEVLNNLGHLLQTTGRPREAIDAYQSAIRHRPDMAETHSNLAEAFRSESRLPEALEAARRAVELKPDFPAAHGNLGNALNGLASVWRKAAAS